MFIDIYFSDFYVLGNMLEVGVKNWKSFYF